MKILFLVVLIIIYLVLKYKFGNIKKPVLGRKYSSRKRLNDSHLKILMQYSRYYRLLTDDLKKSYGDRILRFIESKEYIVRTGLELTDLMKVLIADSAIKLTFGLETFLFEKFDKIIIFKGEFYSDYSHSKEKGETNPRGAIVFSWKDFLDGDLNDSDNINLGLHEFSHALMNQTVGEGGYEDDYFLSNVDLFLDFYKDNEKLNIIKKNEYFRKYAFRNEMEFFAVAIEHFFETPVQFKNEMPELYGILSQLLNQDTAQFYALDKSVKEENSISEGQKDSNDSVTPDQPHQS
jgi:MtfA peptidase